MKKERTLWLDLDGVIVEIAKNLAEYEEARVFSRLGLISEAKSFISKLMEITSEKNVELKVISKAFFKEGLDITNIQKSDKIEVCKSLGFAIENIVILGSDVDKGQFCKPMDILIDDYGKNIENWQEALGIGIQAFEQKIKNDWITARNYNHILSEVKSIL